MGKGKRYCYLPRPNTIKVHKSQKHFKYLLLTLLLFGVSELHAQLGFCTGNSGDAIFTETFGTGVTDGPPLGAGVTSYTFTSGTPNDGDYTVSSTTNYFDWHDTEDHTENDLNGKAFIVNASFTADEFFRRTVTGLCENTSYEFSSWLISLQTSQGCGGNGIPVNVKFEIWDSTNTTLLASGDTGNIPNTSSPTWRPFGLVFKTAPEQTSVILKMKNNSDGGCGNDLAIDDIVFRSCGDFIGISDPELATGRGICDDEVPFNTTLTANPDFTIYTTHAYQWQVSTDLVNWTDIVGETNQTYDTPAIFNDTFYRVLVAEDAVNLTNSRCNSASEIFRINVVSRPLAPISNGDGASCANDHGTISVSVPEGITVNWYDSAMGGLLLAEGSTVFQPPGTGTYYAEAVSSLGGCGSALRTAVAFEALPIPVLTDQVLAFCENTTTTLSAGLEAFSYAWSTGETTRDITVDRPDTYSVTVTDARGCSNSKSIRLEEIPMPVIKDIRSEGYSIEILTETDGSYEYSIDGIDYSTSPIFEGVAGGRYDIRVREDNDCGEAVTSFVHFVVPTFFTPNGDGRNDIFEAEGIAFFPNSEIAIYDRTGKLLKHVVDGPISWNGTFNNSPLPESDYWYMIRVADTVYKGHFSLKR